MNCEALGLEETFWGTCFEHVFLRHVNMLQYMKTFEKVSNVHVFIKFTQGDLLECIT
jgi:hypothetical protein